MFYSCFPEDFISRNLPPVKSIFDCYLRTMQTDEFFMQRCIDLALLGGVEVAPNPMVGAVIVRDGKVLGEGYHQKCGEAHAEVNAVNAVADKALLSEATIYVTLEPCAHFGKTPPCADLIVHHKFKRVVIGCLDPFHAVAGKGIERIREAGIEVTVGVLEKECLQLNKRFFTFHNKQRPYIILKWAQTSDGFVDSVRDDQSERKINWISAPETQSLVHQWRSEEQAILVGWKTVEHDNPSLTVREITGKNPLRVIIDGQLKMPEDSTIYSDSGKTLVLNRIKNETIGNVEFVKLPVIDTENILRALYERSILSVFVEGGSRTIQHFLVDNAWDEARVISGNSIFKNGTRAPRIAGVPDHSFSFSTDKIHQYFRK